MVLKLLFIMSIISVIVTTGDRTKNCGGGNNCLICDSTDQSICYECDAGFFGEECDQTCPVNCSSNSCRFEDGACHACKDGMWGKACNKACGNCLTPYEIPTCNQNNGRCDGNECQDSYHGDNCTTKCGKYCMQGLCDKDTGNCKFGCVDNTHYGAKCNETCFHGCAGGCDGKSGECTDCIDGRWGKGCNNLCAGRCQKCKRDTGECLVCKLGRYGIESCSKQCRWCGTGGCHIDGVCLRCDVGFFGLHCNKRCSHMCENGPCQQVSGRCGTDQVEKRESECPFSNCPFICIGVFLFVCAIIVAIHYALFKLVWVKEFEDEKLRFSEAFRKYFHFDSV